MLARLTTAFLTTVAFMLIASVAMAQGAKKYAVLPFEYNGPQKYAYFPKAFQASLNSDLEWTGHVEPVDETFTQHIKKPHGKAGLLKVLKSTKLDFLISGSISILGDNADLIIDAAGHNGKQYRKKGHIPINEISSWLEKQARAITGDVFNRPGYGSAESTQKQQATQTGQKQKTNPVNEQFVQASDEQYQVASLNPQFRYEGGTNVDGRWRSQSMRYSSNSMVIADGNGDGKNEVFIVTDHTLYAYAFDNGSLKQLSSFELPSKVTAFRLETMDMDRDGAFELVVAGHTTRKEKQLEAPEINAKSFILSFKGNKFSYLLKNYRKFLGVLRTPPTYMPILVEQRKGSSTLFRKEVHEVYFKDGAITSGPRIVLPEQANIFSMTYLPDGFGYKYLVVDDFHRLRVYDQTQERIFSSDEDHFNSSAVGIETSERMPGMGGGVTDEKTNFYNMPIRLVTKSFSKDGKYQLLVNKDLSVAAQFFSHYTYFSQGEIHALGWDGVGMNLAWKTRRIKGQVSDIAIADLNNDGKEQLVVLLNTFPGSIGFTKRKTVVIAYDLNL